MSGRPKASTIGQYDGDGRWTSVVVARLDDVLGGGDAHEAAVLVLAVLAVPELVERA